jgi:hypothetical protein
MKNKIIHHAFRTEFRGRIVNTIVTPAYVEAPSALAYVGTIKPIKVNAIWDTGATDSVITRQIVELLALVPTGRTIVRGVNSEMEVFTYFVNIGLPNRIMIENVKVTECELNSPGIDILIGMNIIQLGDLAITNGKGYTVFSFAMPSFVNPVDLLDKANAINPKPKKK